MEPIDAHFVAALRGLDARPEPIVLTPDDAQRLVTLFTAQARSRHCDFAARTLQKSREAFYTIGSAGHEANAAVALALRPDDPALLHYRSGGFYAARASQVPGAAPVRDVLEGAMSSTSDQISGGRHKVFGNHRLAVIPQTSTIGSHLPRAFGLAFSLDNMARGEIDSPWPEDAVVVCSFGDASANHSTAQGALNASAYCVHRGMPLPILYVCEDNGIGISTKTPAGWIPNMMRSFPGMTYHDTAGQSPVELLQTLDLAVAGVRQQRRPAIVRLETVRFMGHAGSDAEIAYRSTREIEADHPKDPLLATAAALVAAGVWSAEEVGARYEEVRQEVAEAAAAVPRRYLETAQQVVAPIVESHPEQVAAASALAAPDRAEHFRGKLPEDQGPMTLAQAVNASLRDVMVARREVAVFGEDVARKGGVYGVTRGLQRAFGAHRVFDTLLDEQTVLGTALGSALAGFLPVPEIQYLAYLHNAEDQLRGEAATLRFFSAGQFENGMVVRIAGLAYQKGFGGHFHNDNSVAVLRDIPGLMLAVPSHPASAPGLLRRCIALAREEGRVCVFLEPIALYHQRDLHEGDGRWLADYDPPERWAHVDARATGLRQVRDGDDLLLVTFGNGVPMSLRAADELSARRSGEAAVVDLQWLAPLPTEELLAVAAGYRRVLVVDETRRSGGVSEAVVTALVDGGYDGRVARVTSTDSFIPLGPAADHVLLGVPEIIAAAQSLLP